MATKEQLKELIDSYYLWHKETLNKADSLTQSRDWVNGEKQMIKAKTILQVIEDLNKLIHGKF